MIHGIVPPIPTPLTADEGIDESATRRLVELHVRAGVGAIWVLGTTGRFDLVTDRAQRRFAEIVAEVTAGRVPLILNVSDMGTRRVLERAAAYDDLPYDAYSALCPWYQKLSRPQLTDFFHRLGDELSRPLLIYNAPWVDNCLAFDHLRELAAHPRIVGAKDVTTDYTRAMIWTKAERAASGFSYIIGGPQVATCATMGADGNVTAMSGVYPELCVAAWNAAQRDDHDAATRIQQQLMTIMTTYRFAHNMSCLEVMFRHRGLGQYVCAHPLPHLDDDVAASVIEVVESVGAPGREQTLEQLERALG